MTDVLLVGEPMVMFYATENGDLSQANYFSKGLAGAEVNVGIGLSRLEKKVSYLTKLGKDSFGSYIYQNLKAEKLNVEHTYFDLQRSTGIMIKSKIKDGDPETVYYRKGSAFSTLSIEDIKKVDFDEVKVLHLTGIPPALSDSARKACYYLVKKAKEAGCFITFDPNLRPSLWENQTLMIETLNDLAKYADIVLPGISEGEILVGTDDIETIAKFYLNMGVETVIIKTGTEGAYVANKEIPIYNVPGFKVEEVVDTVGAGDGFAVGIISGHLDGLSIHDSVIRANAIGSIQVQHPADNEGLPVRLELEAYIESQKVKL